MNKSDLVNRIAAETGQNNEQVEIVVEAIFKQVRKALVKGNTIYLRGFGNFEVRHRAARKARDIRRKITIDIPSTKYPAFKPCKGFMEQVKTANQ
jgi:DNA-binding protein HU-beta